MQAVLKDLSLWFWRLVPANPILVRVVSAGGKRFRHLVIRLVYLATLAFAVVAGVVFTQKAGGGSSLADLAKNATFVFKHLSNLQLFMVCILAPVFAAAAITQEKDSQTYSILLSTPLTNGQIVLGSLLSRLYFVFVLLFAGIPLFCIMMVYGGVTGDKIALSIGLAGATALLTGTLAIVISVIKIGTGRTVFSFYLAIAVYLIVVYSLAWVPGLIPAEAVPAPGQTDRMSWLAAFHPFLALKVVLGETPAPEFGAVAHYGFPSSYLLAYPFYSYIVMSVLISAVLIVISLFFVRRSAKEGEATLWSRLFSRRARQGRQEDSGGRTRKPRHVKRNPISWRESVTGAAAGGGALVRYLTIGIGLCLAIALLVYYVAGGLTPAQTRIWLYGIVAVELGIALFVAMTTAATSMTREKESNTLELVLATPLTSAQIIRGKIIGLVVAAGPMLLVPYLTVGLFLLFDLVSGRLFKGTHVVNWEAMLTLPALLIAFTAFVCMVGLSMSIKNRKTMGAVFTSMGWVLLLFGVMGACAFTMLTSATSEELTAAIMPLAPLTAPYIAIDPVRALSAGVNSTIGDDQLTFCRIVAFIASFCSAGLYLSICLSMHRSMVRNFDMTIRKQTA